MSSNKLPFPSTSRVNLIHRTSSLRNDPCNVELTILTLQTRHNKPDNKHCDPPEPLNDMVDPTCLLSEGQELFSHFLELQSTLDETHTSQYQNMEACVGTTGSVSSDLLCLPRVYVGVGLLSVVRAFAAPEWNSITSTGKSQDCRDNISPPTLSPEAVQNLVISIFDLIEGRLSESSDPGLVGHQHGHSHVDLGIGIESVLYLPALTTVALEIHCVALRKRIMHLFDTIEARGFVAANLASNDIKLAWSMTEPRCGTLCQCAHSEA